MPDIIRQIDQCRVCGANDWFDVISFGDIQLANSLLDPAPNYEGEPAYPLDVVVCRQCWLMTLRHVVDPEELFRHFVWISSDSELMHRHYRRILDWCTDRAGLGSNDLVVELGSNIGTQLALFRDAGQRIVGVDPARNLAQIANDRGVNTIADFFGARVGQQVAREYGSAKLVLGRQCFAHIDDVHDVLAGAEAVLAPDGLVVIEVPYLLDLLQENQFDTIYHEHLSYYSLGTFRWLFESHGLRVVAVERAPVHGGSIVVFAARADSGREAEPGVAELLAEEQRYGLSTERPYREFAARSQELITAVGDLVRGLVAQGKRVAAYGAPSKGTTLLMMSGLTAEEIEFCSDNTPLKQNKVLPGSHVPVWPPERAREHAPDYYLLLAWNYAEEILRKERAFMERGGRFILPNPAPHIVGPQGVEHGELPKAS